MLVEPHLGLERKTNAGLCPILISFSYDKRICTCPNCIDRLYSTSVQFFSTTYRGRDLSLQISRFLNSMFPCYILLYCLHAQLQSATEQLSDEQQPASQEQSEHPEFPQLQPITKNAAQSVKIIFFIFSFSFYYLDVRAS